jgi:hypothetical protein
MPSFLVQFLKAAYNDNPRGDKDGKQNFFFYIWLLCPPLLMLDPGPTGSIIRGMEDESDRYIALYQHTGDQGDAGFTM